MTIRKPAVAGTFYPADPIELKIMIEGFLKSVKIDYSIPKAMIVPHAGYIYSGLIAASAYACLKKSSASINRVVLLGPSHQYPFSGLAIPSDDVFETPLGSLSLDSALIKKISNLPQVSVLNEAHQFEHCLEVQLPFLQMLLKSFTIIPIVVGEATPGVIAQTLGAVWGDDKTLIVISSDLSHYFDYKKAQQLDKATADAILQLDPEAIGDEQACGRLPILGLLTLAQQKHLQPLLLDLRNSGDTAGPKDQVVGYGAFHFREGA